MITNQDLKKYKQALKSNIARRYNSLKWSKTSYLYSIESSAVYSSNIEGNSMDLNSFMNTKLTAKKQKPKEYKEIIDLVNTYEFAKKESLNEKNYLKSHQMLSNNFLIKSKQGRYREERIGVFDSTGLVYMAIEAKKVSDEMKNLFIKIDKLLKVKLGAKEVFYFASLLHLQLAHIHPFSDGNGRAARLLEKWFLASKLDKKAWMIASEKHYKENLNEYYKNINLGPNFYELNYKKSLPFLLMLPKALDN